MVPRLEPTSVTPTTSGHIHTHSERGGIVDKHSFYCSYIASSQMDAPDPYSLVYYSDSDSASC